MPSEELNPESFVAIAHPPSPLLKQKTDRKAQPGAEPVTLIFLTGSKKGEAIDLGFNISEISHNQSAEWNPQTNSAIRIGATFRKLQFREITFSAEFYDLQEDIAHLGENLAHLQMIEADTKTPPLILFVQGSARGTKCICKSIKWQYDYPLAESKGFHHAKVDISLDLLGGLGSADQLGQPLTATPLNDNVLNQDNIRRQLEGNARVTQQLLEPCLGGEGSERIADLVRNRKLNNIESLMSVDDHALYQMAVGGMIPPSVIGNEALVNRLRRATATVMARNLNGTRSNRESYAIAEYLLSDTGENIPALPGDLAELSSQAPNLINNFREIFNAIKNQQIRSGGLLGGDVGGSVFANERNPELAELFAQMSYCGMVLRQARADQFANVTPDSPEDAAIVAAINTFLSDPSTTDDDIKTRFGVTSRIQVNEIRNSAPFDSKQDFWDRATPSQVGMTSMSLWQTFENTANQSEESSDEDNSFDGNE